MEGKMRKRKKRNGKVIRSPFFTSRRDKREVRIGGICKKKAKVIDELYAKTDPEVRR